VAGFLALAAMGVPSAARAEPPQPAPEQAAAADGHFRQGVALYKEQSFAAALVEFRKAYAILPDWHVLYDIGITQVALKDDAGAFTAFTRYLREGSTISDKRKAEVEASLERVRDRIGTLRVAVNREGAEITVDDVSVGKSPLSEPLVVNIGPRMVVATLPGGQKASRLVDVASRDSVSVDLEFAGEAQPIPVGTVAVPSTSPEQATLPPPDAAPRPHQPDYLWVGVVTTAALTAGGVVTGLLALKAKSDSDSDVSQFGTTASALQDANSQKRTFAAVTDALLGSAVVAGGITLYFALRHPSASAGSTGTVALRLSLEPRGLYVSGGF
jgi:hypothetical protein